MPPLPPSADRANHPSGARIGSLGILESQLSSSLTDKVQLRLRQVNFVRGEPHRRSRQLETMVRESPSLRPAKRDLLPMMATRTDDPMRQPDAKRNSFCGCLWRFLAVCCLTTASHRRHARSGSPSGHETLSSLRQKPWDGAQSPPSACKRLSGARSMLSLPFANDAWQVGATPRLNSHQIKRHRLACAANPDIDRKR